LRIRSANRPRRLPDGTFYVTDVRLKRFVRDWLKTQGQTILVDRSEDAATNLTGRLQHFLRDKPEGIKTECEEYEKLFKAAAEKAEAERKAAAAKRAKAKKNQGEAATGSAEAAKPTDETEAVKLPDEPEEADTSSPAVQAGRLVVSIILKAFIDARLFGSSFAFKDWEVGGKNIAPRPKTLTGAVQINMGEVLHPAHELDLRGTSIFTSKGDETQTQGTFTTYFGLRYGLIGFNGIANEHSAKLSQLTDADYERLCRTSGRS
jgi:CRISPR-associated protein Csh2